MKVRIDDNSHRGKLVYAGTKFCQVYDDAIPAIMGLSSPTAFKLSIWLARRMDEENVVQIKRYEKIRFSKELALFGSNEISVSAIEKAVAALVFAELIQPISLGNQRRGLYLVNPKYFWRGKSQKERSEKIKVFNELLLKREHEKD